MQHYQPNRLCVGADMVPPRPTERLVEGRHSALLLIGDRGAGRLSSQLARRVLDRLLAPAAQVEGVDYHLNDPSLLEQATQSKAFALVMPPVGNLSNRFYAVHPRRNDRFLTARPELKALFPEVDFATMAFTGHVLSTLAATCPERYAEVRRAITTAWVSRMQGLLRSLPSQGALIDLPTPSWQQRPLIPSEGRRRVFIDTDDRAAGAETLRAALVTRSA